MIRLIVAIIILLSKPCIGLSQNPDSDNTKQLSQQLSKRLSKRLNAFAKLYGYVKYFHPSDEAAELDWDYFAIYGVRKILNNNQDDFHDLLKELFQPIAPTANFVNKKNKDLLNHFYEENIQGFSNEKFLMWIHNGDGKLKEGRTYNSTRVEINGYDIDKNEYSITLDISGKPIIIPHYVLSKQARLSMINSKSYQSLLSSMENTSKNLKGQEISKVGTIAYLINAYNSIKHFYPYFNKKDSDKWDNYFADIIEAVLNDDKQTRSSINWLRLLLSHLNDAHVDVYKKNDSKAYPDIFIRYVDNQYIIYNTTENYSSLKGTRVKKVDGKPLEELINNQIQFVSYGVKAFGIQEALKKILGRRPFSMIQFELESSNLRDTIVNMNCFSSLGAYTVLGEYSKIGKTFSEVNSNTCYLNLVDLTSIDDKFQIKQQSKYNNIIIDIRGYPTLNSKDKNSLISYFLKENDTLNWLFVPIVKLPNQTNEDYSFKPSGWKLPKNDSPFDHDIFVLIDHMAVSYSESIIGYFANLPKAKLVGSPTAGANGNINTISLPDKVIYEYTGMKVLKHDGSRLHGIGFLPDVEVKPTIQGVIDGRDEVLEKAIELAREGIKRN